MCAEHGLNVDGTLKEDVTPSEGINTFFSDTKSGRYVPRTCFIDLEPGCLDEIRTGNTRRLFHPQELVNGKEGGASNFARGHYTIGRDLLDRAVSATRPAASLFDGFRCSARDISALTTARNVSAGGTSYLDPLYLPMYASILFLSPPAR